MIPTSVTRELLVSAIQQIDSEGVPRGRSSRGYDLVHEGRSYPPKYALALAIEAATGRVADPDDFGGGDETNTFLRGLGFVVVTKGERAPVAPTKAAPPTVVPSSTSDRSPPTPRSIAPGGAATVRVGRVFLNIGVKMGEFLSSEAEEGHAFFRMTQGQLNDNPKAYRDRIVSLIRRAHDAGAEVVALPACALIVGENVTVESYAVPSVPVVVAGEAQRGEFAVVMRHGVVTERIDNKDEEVRWFDAGRFTVLAAISSTIGRVVQGKKYKVPVRSKHSPPDPEKPILVVDVGHRQYGSRYLKTLRCVARDASPSGKPTAVVLSSWMWATKGIEGPWCQPEARVTVKRFSSPDEPDVLDIIDVNLSSPVGR